MLSFRAINSFHFRRSTLLSTIARSHVRSSQLRSTQEFIGTKVTKSVPDFKLIPPLSHGGTSIAVTPVLTRQEARRVLKIMEAHPDAIWACDTEVADIDVKEQSPVGNGKVICVSIFGGEHINFGHGSTLWIENIGHSEGVLEEFKSFFEDQNTKKVWHNYGFDRHVMNNEGINCQGFHADTMHMARLWDTSRDKASGSPGGGEGYSLASLTEEFFSDDSRFIKTKMIQLFGVSLLRKDGTPSAKKELPPIRNLQIDPNTREKWIEYSARDAFTTFHVYQALAEKLRKMPWNVDNRNLGNMLQFYLQYWRNFGELLTDLEKVGIQVDKNGHLKKAEELARIERDKMTNLFLTWVAETCPKVDISSLNLASSIQISHLLFGEYNVNQQLVKKTRTFEIKRSKEEMAQARLDALSVNPYALCTLADLKVKLKERKITPLSGTRDVLMRRLFDYDEEMKNGGKIEGKVDQILKKNQAKMEEKKKEIEVLKSRLFAVNFPYETVTVPELKKLAKLKNLVVKSAKKAKKGDLITLLRSHDETAEKLLSAYRAEYDTKTESEIDSLILEKSFLSGLSLTKEQKVDLLVEFDRRVAIYAAMPMEDLLTLLNQQQQQAIKVKEEEEEDDDDDTAPQDWPEPMTLIHTQVAHELRRQAVVAADTTEVVPTLIDANDSQQVDSEVDQFNVLLVGKPSSTKEFSITTIGLAPVDFTPGGVPQVSAAVLKKLAGSNIDFSSSSSSSSGADTVDGDRKTKWGTAYDFFGGGEAGRKACTAIGALAAAGQLDTTINSFLVPLQQLADSENRIHCSLNLNTETGRLSARRPNLQNQPALEKDQFKIRDAFIAPPGKTLIVADYGQLELRILAHITNCASMISAFEQGGCFHSRTAVGMYEHVKQAVDEGKVLLEWDYSKGQPTVPLVKDTYAAERRKAKTLNFSIAYGKTVHGLALDWGITKEEAEQTLEAWYRDRPEVKEWQMNTQAMARKKGYVLTMMGRYRRLPDARQDTLSSSSAAGHALRAAINTPIQGSAADVVMMAMIKLWQSPTLKRLGWRLLLQIHDEVILEGPKESVDEAMKEVRDCMENPFDDFGLSKLRVHLDVDAKSADSWYKAK